MGDQYSNITILQRVLDSDCYFFLASRYLSTYYRHLSTFFKLKDPNHARITKKRKSFILFNNVYTLDFFKDQTPTNFVLALPRVVYMTNNFPTKSLLLYKSRKFSPETTSK